MPKKKQQKALKVRVFGKDVHHLFGGPRKMKGRLIGTSDLATCVKPGELFIPEGRFSDDCPIFRVEIDENHPERFIIALDSVGQHHLIETEDGLLYKWDTTQWVKVSAFVNFSDVVASEPPEPEDDRQ